MLTVPFDLYDQCPMFLDELGYSSPVMKRRDYRTKKWYMAEAYKEACKRPDSKMPLVWIRDFQYVVDIDFSKESKSYALFPVVTVVYDGYHVADYGFNSNDQISLWSD